MATWIVHLRLAEKLYHKCKNLQLDKKAFYLGNVAIDSGHVNEDGTTTPARHITHWFENEKMNRGCRYEDFFKVFLKNQKDDFAYSFYLGCVSHLITDNLWINKIVDETKKKYIEELKHDEKFMQKPKLDWYNLDFEYLRKHPQFEPLKLLATVCDFDNNYLPWFEKNAVQSKVNELLDFYQCVPANLDNDYVYLNEKQMTQFIDDAAQIIYDELHCLIDKYSFF